MSDEKQLARDERRKLREELKARKVAEREEMLADQREDVEDLIESQGIGDNVVTIETDLGILACKKAPPHEMDRFNAFINGDIASSKKNHKKRAKSTEDAIRALVRSARLYPESEEFERILAEYPICWNTLAAGLADLAGATFEADVRKN